MSGIAELMHDPELCTGFEILRRSEGMVKGRAVITETRENAVGIVQPATPRELERIPEADRVKGTIVVYTATLLRVGDEEQGIAADGIAWGGDVYTVTSVDDWQQWGYYRALAQRETA